MSDEQQEQSEGRKQFEADLPKAAKVGEKILKFMSKRYTTQQIGFIACVAAAVKIAHMTGMNYQLFMGMCNEIYTRLSTEGEKNEV